MANQLKMAEIHAILTLRARGWSFRRIARELGVHRETVAGYVQRAAAYAEANLAKPAIAPTGVASPEPPDGLRGPAPPGAANAPIAPAPPKPAIAPPGSVAGLDRLCSVPDAHLVLPPPGRAGPVSGCEPYRSVILDKLDAGLSAVRIHQDLTTEHGATLSYHAVRRFVRKLRTQSPLPFRRMECEPGAEVQVDFGTAAPVITPEGKRRRPHLFRIVLSHSRKAYSEAVYRQTTDDFLRCLENAFHHFGGVPQTLVIDNLKAAVAKADWFDPDLNPKILAFCEHYGTVVLPTKVRTPRHTGKVERGVGYAQDNALKGRTFDNLSDQNRFLLDWETTVADTRIHGTTRKQVGKVFAEVEQAALLPLPIERFACFREAQRTVNRDGHVEVAKAYYSAPPEYVGRRVWARWDGRTVRIFDKQLQQIAIHAQLEPGRFATDDRHIVAEKRSGIERGTAWWLRKARFIGADTGRWAENIVQQRGVHGVRTLMGLVGLTNKHTDTAIDQACRVAQSHGAYRLRDIRNLIKRQAPTQEQFEFIAEHPLIRSLADYGQLVHDAFEEVHA
jgi:transposase